MRLSERRIVDRVLSQIGMTAIPIPCKRLLAVSLVIVAVVFLEACGQNNPLVEAFRDSDNDGWYDENRNQQIQLFIDSVENHTGTVFGNLPAIAIDGRIVTRYAESTPSDFPVATRTIGTWGVPERIDEFHGDLRITIGDLSTSDRRTFSFKSEDSTFAVNHSGYTVHFRTVRTLFSDPSPTDADGDTDQDGLTDKEEWEVNSPNRSVGTPLEKDLLLVVAFTHRDWAMTQKSQDELSTIFFNRKRINLNIYTQDDPVLNITPGQIKINGETPGRGHKLAFAEGKELRSQLVPDRIAGLFHVLALAEELNDGSWGRAEVGRPANDLICRSHLPLLGPDHFDYQSKDIMHELGHNLGLCHPTESTSSCPTGAIPASERNGGQSAMGTPAEATDPVSVMLEALSRPLNYTPGQWDNLDLRRLKAP